MSKEVMNEYILLDRSGSMGVRWDETISSINSYVEEAKGKVKTKVTVATFDHQAGLQFDIIRNKVSAKKWDPITKKEALPRGMTPLFDAIGKLVSLAEQEDNKRTVIIIMTDGAENASREVSRETAKAALDRCRERNWQVVFLGADFDAFGQSASVGTSIDQTLNMSKGNYGRVMRTMRSKTAAYADAGASVEFSASDRAEAGQVS